MYFLLAGSTYNDNDIDDEYNKEEVGKEAEGGIPELLDKVCYTSTPHSKL